MTLKSGLSLKRTLIALFVVLATLGKPNDSIAEMKSFPAQARLFLGSTTVSPTELNQTMSSQGLPTFGNIGEYGVEITYAALRFLDVGLRYEHKSTLKSGTNVSDFGSLSQDVGLLVARIPIIRTSLFKVDVYGGVGGANTSFELTTSGTSGKLTKSATQDTFASPFLSTGASAGVGYKSFYFFVESGLERNLVSGFSKTGTISGTVNTAGLNGAYAMFGILFDGVTARQR